MLNIRALEKGDIHYVAAHLRESDRRELCAMRGGDVDVKRQLALAVLVSSHYWTVAAENPIAIFGVSPMDRANGIGSPWLLATDEAPHSPKDWIRLSKKYLQLMTKEYPVLINYVDARNRRSIAWLKHLGFRFGDPEPLGPYGIPFCRFEMVTPCVSQ